jgi:hypothetical protein
LFWWLRLYATDYFVGILFVTGLLLLLRFRVWAHTSFRNVFISVLSVLFLLGLIYVVGTELADVTLSGTRWWRFPAITLLGFPLCLADEVMVRPAVALVGRVMVGAIVVTAGLTLHRDAAFLLLLYAGRAGILDSPLVSHRGGTPPNGCGRRRSVRRSHPGLGVLSTLRYDLNVLDPPVSGLYKYSLE